MHLDATAEYHRVDPADALADVEETAAQWEQAVRGAPAPLDLPDIDAVVCCGMGGSGIAGEVLQAVATGTFDRPVLVHRGYGVPAFVGPRTLVVAFSHSGGTEETLSAFEEAGRRGAARLAITGGGALLAAAEDAGVRAVVFDAQGRPPRHSLGSLLVPALTALGLGDGLNEAVETLHALQRALGRDVASGDNPLKALATRLAGGVVPLVWGGQGLGAVAAYRLKCQLNENAKMPAMHVVLPEGDHNDIVGWERPSPLTGVGAVIAVRDPGGEHEGVRRRFAITLEQVLPQLVLHAELVAVGRATVARVASLLFQCDLLSVYTALAADQDPTPVSSIDRLKERLQAPAARS